MDFPANRQAERVRQILSTRHLTFYRASQLSLEVFGRSSPFHLPRNLYHRLAASTATPSIYQLFALSRVTNYRLNDWLAVFGFDLDVISQLAVLIPSRRTVILDSYVYDSEAWVPWFVDRPGIATIDAITPLGQFLSRAGPERVKELLSRSKTHFLYAKVGQGDLLAFPDVGPGSIIRIDTRQSKEASSLAKNLPDEQIFLVEHDLGFVCSRLSTLGNGRVTFRSPQLPFAEGGFTLGRDLRILGVVDSEILPVPDHQGPVAQLATTTAQKREAAEAILWSSHCCRKCSPKITRSKKCEPRSVLSTHFLYHGHPSDPRYFVYRFPCIYKDASPPSSPFRTLRETQAHD
jgi:hypothetical protein